MIDLGFWSINRVTGIFLVLSFAANLAGVLMFFFRDGMHGGAPPNRAYFAWERGLLVAAVILTTVGFVLLDAALQNTGGHILARIGATTYFLAGILVVVAEAATLSQGESAKFYALVVIYVVLAFLAQAAVGGALVQAGLLPAWIGWTTIGWNLVWLLVLPLATPNDIYFPVLHHLMPLVMGIGTPVESTVTPTAIAGCSQRGVT